MANCTIKVNVGGQYFTTSLQTLTKDKGSMLYAMFSGRFDTKPGEDGSYFIDRDGTHFRYVLNYLRTGYLLVPDDKLIRKEILEEAEFYQIRGIVDELCPPPFLGSKILSDDQKQIFVNTWLKHRIDRRHSSLPADVPWGLFCLSRIDFSPRTSAKLSRLLRSALFTISQSRL